MIKKALLYYRTGRSLFEKYPFNKEQQDQLLGTINKSIDDFKSALDAKEAQKKWDAEWVIEKERFIKFCEKLDFDDTNAYPLAQLITGIPMKDGGPFKEMVLKMELVAKEKKRKT